MIGRSVGLSGYVCGDEGGRWVCCASLGVTRARRPPVIPLVPNVCQLRGWLIPQISDGLCQLLGVWTFQRSVGVSLQSAHSFKCTMRIRMMHQKRNKTMVKVVTHPSRCSVFMSGDQLHKYILYNHVAVKSHDNLVACYDCYFETKDSVVRLFFEILPESHVRSKGHILKCKVLNEKPVLLEFRARIPIAFLSHANDFKKCRQIRCKEIK